MTTPQKAKQSTSRWGFLSQAVASVESGLDKILAEENEAPQKPTPKPVTTQQNGSSPRPSSDIIPSDSTTRINDRLQARLAQAMVKKGGSRSTTPQPGSELTSPPDTPGPSNNTVGEIQLREAEPSQHEMNDTEQEHREEHSEQPFNVLDAVGIPSIDVMPQTSEVKVQNSETSPRNSIESTAAVSAGSLDRPRPSANSGRQSWQLAAGQSLSEVLQPDAQLLNVQLEHEKSLSELQGEMNDYLERIDALQRNLHILTKETIQNAKRTKDDAQVNFETKQLAEKDERIALLIEEGTKLTKSEMQYRNIIKKLRAQAATATKDQEAVQRRATTAEKSLADLETRAMKAESEAKRVTAQVGSLSKTSSDVEAITKERNSLQATLAEVRSQLGKANKRAEDAESKARSDKLEIERRKNAELQDDLSSAKVERELNEDKLKREIEDLRLSLTREKEQARQMETEMLAEQAALESKLESFRVRAEEASSSDRGDSHAKLLRQIETLQSQYSAASQNWQGIESTLLARITALEKERDEVVARETDVRRKLRDATTKGKIASKELEEVQQVLNTMHDREADSQSEVQRTTKRVEQLEDELTKLREEFDNQRVRAEKDTSRRIEEEKTKWLASIPQHIHRIDSPVASLRKGTGGLFIEGLMSPIERPTSRRSSHQPLYESSMSLPPSRINSAASVRANGHLASPIPETPSIMIADDQDDFFGNVPATPASTALTHAESIGTRGVNDVISASTAAAGPSVQLVERLSTNVRRLESEKAASKDEITRLNTQRDASRQEVVNLMREIESKRMVEERLANIEKEHAETSEKYERTLELLGEKTELVEELKADIIDVKQMYRHLADTMGK